METVLQNLEDLRAQSIAQAPKPEPFPVRQLVGLGLLVLIGLTGRIAPDAMLSLAVKLLAH